MFTFYMVGGILIKSSVRRIVSILIVKLISQLERRDKEVKILVSN